MSADQEVEVYAYTLNIQSVKMKVKFPCKMILEHDGVTTPEVSQNDAGKFIFNHQLTLQEDSDQTHFEILVHLNTEKGSKYVAGIVKLMQSQLVHQEGEMLRVPLLKCIDAEAICELRIDQVSTAKVTKKPENERYSFGRNRVKEHNLSPGARLQSPMNIKGTQSEFNFPLHNSKLKRPVQEAQSIYNQRSPGGFMKRTHIAATHMERNTMQLGLDSINRDKLIEAEVYKDSYQKLKQKYKREAENAKNQMNKRMALENAQNNYKLEIMRLKLRSEEQEKILTDKTARIKEIQQQLNNLQKKQLDLDFFKEENSNKDHTIKMLEQTIRTLNRDNEDLKTLNRQRFEGEQQKIKDLRNEIETLKQTHEGKLLEFERQNKMRIQLITQKETQIRIRDERIQRQQQMVSELEKLSQTKMIEFERSLQAEKNQAKIRIDELKNTISRLQKEKQKLQEELDESKYDTERAKAQIIKIEYDKRIIGQENDGFKGELTELKAIKDKYHELSREHRLLTEDKNHLQRQLEKALQTKDNSISDLNKQHQEQLDHYKKIYREVDEKLKNTLSKNLELQTSLEQKKNQNEKNKKLNQNLTRELNQTREREAGLKKNLKDKEEKYSTLGSQMDNIRHKFKSGDQLSKYQIENLKEQLGKLKIEHEALTMKFTQQGEKNSNLTSEVSKLKLKLQNSVDQGEKATQLHKEKVEMMEGAARDLERKIEDLNLTVANLRTNDKENQSKIQTLEIQGLKRREKIERLQKQIRNYEQKVQSQQTTIKNKQNQLIQLQHSKEGVQRKLSETEEKLSLARNNFSTATGEKNKNQKIIELLNREINEAKQQIEKAQKKIIEREQQGEDLRNDVKKGKQEYLKLEMKHNALKKEFEKFKEVLIETLSSTYSQIPLGADLKGSQVSLDYKKNGEAGEGGIMNSEIVNRISSQNKDIKIAMSKMIEQNKAFQKEIDQLHEDITNNGNKNQSSEAKLNKQIQKLEEDLQRVHVEKEEVSGNLAKEIFDLKEELEDKHQTIDDLQQKIQQLNFTINSLKMDDEGKSEHYLYKQNQYKSKIAELEQKINFLTVNIQEVEGRSTQFESQLSQVSSELEQQRETLEKKQKEIVDLTAEKNSLFITNEEGKKYRKELLQKISELELKLGSQMQNNEKTKQLLEDEEHKAKELKEFVNTLVKEKETVIKSDLKKSDQIIELQAQIIETTRDKEMQEDENARLKKIVEEQKQLIKRLNGQGKDQDLSLNQQKSRASKLSEKLKESQRELKEVQETFEKFKEETNKLISKANKENTDLRSQLEDLYKLKEGMSGELTERIHELSREIREAESKNSQLKNQVTILQENLFTQKQAKQMKVQELARLSQDFDEAKKEARSLSETIKKLQEQINEKQESLYEYSDKVYCLEVRAENLSKENQERIEEIIEDWSTKYDMACEESEQRLALVEKDKEYLKERLEEKEEQYRKTMAELRNTELDDANTKKVLEDKVKRLEEERLNLLASKNSQLQRLAEQNKTTFENMKNKEADMRRMQHELDVARNTISKLETNKRQTEEKIRHLSKVYQGELEQLKKREAANRSSKQQLGRIQWDIEKQMKKMMQSYSKKMISGQSKQSSQKILTSVKGMQEQLMTLIAAKMGESK